MEFALTLPVLLMLVGGLADYGQAFWVKKVLAESVSQGTQYAFLAGPTVSTIVVRGIVQQKLALPSNSVSVVGPACFCTSGIPAASSPQACSQPCPNGISAGISLTISAQYTFTPLMSFYSQLGSTTLTQSSTVRLQ